MMETDRLLLRNYSGTDKEIQDMLKNWVADPAVQAEYGEPVYETYAAVRELLDRYMAEPYRWAVWEKKSGECIGQIAFCKTWDDIRTAEIEYCIGQRFQGNRYAGEALKAVIRYAFTRTGFEKLEAFHRKANPRSGRVLMKSCMHVTDTVERFRRQGTDPADEVCYCITASEWKRMQVQYRWTDGKDEDFRRFYLKTEEYYSRIVGGVQNRRAFVPYNLSDTISDVIVAGMDGAAVGCAGLKAYSESDAEIKRVWVEPDYRGNHIADEMMNRIEKRAKELGFRRTILQTRPIMRDAVGLYRKRGYYPIDNYPPYDRLDGAVCFAKDLEMPGNREQEGLPDECGKSRDEGY